MAKVRPIKEQQAAAVALAKKAVEDLDDATHQCRKLGLEVTPRLQDSKGSKVELPDGTVNLEILRPAEEL